MLTTIVNGKEYDLATSLRVAYLVQGQHNHKPYSEVFEGIGEMVLEDQIGILYCAFKVANPDAAKFIKREDFFNSYLDTFTLKQVMDQLEKVIKGIMGTEEEKPKGATSAENGDEDEDGSEGN